MKRMTNGAKIQNYINTDDDFSFYNGQNMHVRIIYFVHLWFTVSIEIYEKEYDSHYIYDWIKRTWYKFCLIFKKIV